MKMLVTGATGFIGSRLVDALKGGKHSIRALALPGEDTSALEKHGVDVRRGDLTKPGSLSGICDGIDVVFHLAGRVTDWGTRDLFDAAILDATRNLMKEASGKAKRFVYVSSIAAMGMGTHLKGAKETDDPRKSGIPYNDAKADAEALVMAHHNAGTIACTIVRPANVTGPGSVWVRDIVERMLQMPVPLFDGGRHSASLVYVDNLVDGIVLAGTKDIARGKAYHFRDDWRVTWKQYVEDLGSIIGKRPHGSLPFRLAWTIARVIEPLLNPLGIRPPLTRLAVAVMGRDNDVDCSLAKKDLGWKTRVPYEEAKMKIAGWVREHYPAGN